MGETDRWRCAQGDPSALLDDADPSERKVEAGTVHLFPFGDRVLPMMLELSSHDQKCAVLQRQDEFHGRIIISSNQKVPRFTEVC